MDISLPKDLQDYVRSHVEAGNYANNSEVISDALRHMQERHEKIIEDLRQKLIEAEQSGIAEDFSFESLNAEIDAMMAAETKKA